MTERSESLWLEARDEFVQALKTGNVDEVQIQQFLEQQSSAEDARSAAASLKTESEKKYSTIRLPGKTIPAQWISRIMENIKKFMDLGNAVMNFAPETARLGWFAVAQVLRAMSNNFALYSFFSGALNDITDMMVVIGHTDSLYFKYRSPISGQNQSPILQDLFRKIRSLYVAILDFGWSVKKHIDGSKMSKLKHAWKDILGSSQSEFDDKKSRIESLRLAVDKVSTVAYQERSLDDLSSLKDDLKGIRLEMSNASESSSQLKLILDDFEKLTKQKSHFELSLDQFEKNVKDLNPFPDSKTIFNSLFQDRCPGTAEWIFKHEAWKTWDETEHNAALWLFGPPNVGKSTIIACVLKNLYEKLSTNYALQCVTCDPTGSRMPQSRARVQNTIICQLYQLASVDQDHPEILQHCNDIFQSPKEKPKNSSIEDAKSASSQARGATQEAVEKFPDLPLALEKLAKQLTKQPIILVDAVECIASDEQGDFVRALQAVVKSMEFKCKFILTSRVEVLLYRQVSDAGLPIIEIDQEILAPDIDLILQRELEKIPSWSSGEQETAKTFIKQKTGTNLDYLREVAIPFLKQPFPRPIENHLKKLPGNSNEKYIRAWNNLTDTSRSLLHLAITWLIVADQIVQVQDIVDTYTGVYFVDAQTSTYKKRFTPSKFDQDQISNLADPFLSVSLDECEHTVVKLQDPVAIKDFFVDNTNRPNSPHTEHIDNLCRVCERELGSRSPFTVSEREAHLAIALSLEAVTDLIQVKQLNSPIFRKTWLASRELTFDDGDDDDEENKTDNDDNQNKEEAIGITDDKSVSVPETNNDDSRDEHAKATETLGAEPNNSLDNNHDSLETVDEGKTEEHPADAEDDGSESDGLMDDEDGVQRPPWVPEDDYEGDFCFDCLPYSIRSWHYHVNEVSRLFTPQELEERSDWKELQEQIYLFVTQTPDTYKVWLSHILKAPEPGYTPLHLAARFSLVALAKRLITEGANVEQQTADGLQPLHSAITNGGLEIVETLLKAGADPNSTNPLFSFPPLHWSLFMKQSEELFHLLLKYGALCSVVTIGGTTTLHWLAAKSTSLDLFMTVLQNPNNPKDTVDINAEDGDWGETPLHALMRQETISHDLLRAFLENGADANAEDRGSRRPLWEASQYGDVEAMEILLPFVTDIHDENLYGSTALHRAASGGFSKAVELLLLHGADATRRDNYGKTPLIMACTDAQEAAAEVIFDFLIEKGCKVETINSVTRMNRTPLREAANHGLERIVPKLLDIIDDKEALNLQDKKKGQNALHRAAFYGHTEVVKLLLDKGADWTLQDYAGRTALQLCHDQWRIYFSSNLEATVKVLLDHELPNLIVDRSLLFTAASHGSIAILQKLIDANVNVSEPDQYGWTPLTMARQFKQSEAVELISQHLRKLALRPKSWNIQPGSGDFVQVGENSLKFVGEERLVIFADRPVPDDLGEYYFEITINEATIRNNKHRYPLFVIGISNYVANNWRLPGRAKSNPSFGIWGYEASEGYVYSTLPNSPEFYFSTYGVGQTVGVGVNFSTGSLFFTHNGRKTAEEFLGIRGRLFPKVTFDDPITITTNWGDDLNARPFKWRKTEKDESPNSNNVVLNSGSSTINGDMDPSLL